MGNSYSEEMILSHFDSGPDHTPYLAQSIRNPKGGPNDINYHFWFDLEHGYFHTAGSRIHLYADDERWAVVAEKNGYSNRGLQAEIELYYFGNCIDTPSHTYPERTYFSNLKNIVLIDGTEFERICNRTGEDMDQFEVIDPDANYVIIRNTQVPIEQDVTKYRALGIHYRGAWENQKDLISFQDLVRYYSDTNPEALWATEAEIRQHIPGDLKKLMIINEFHFTSVYAKVFNPKEEELYQLIAKILISRDTSFWKPQLEPNNHWSNWESGHL